MRGESQLMDQRCRSHDGITKRHFALLSQPNGLVHHRRVEWQNRNSGKKGTQPLKFISAEFVIAEYFNLADGSNNRCV